MQSYAAPDVFIPPLPYINAASFESVGAKLASIISTAAAAAVWPAANRTIYVPVTPHVPLLVKRMFVLNGGVVGTNTITVALYSSDSNALPASRLVTANATSAGANACQYFDITDTTLAAGVLYYMAVALNGTTATVFRVQDGTTNGAYTKFTEDTVCPATATPVVSATSYLPIFGLDLRG